MERESEQPPIDHIDCIQCQFESGTLQTAGGKYSHIFSWFRYFHMFFFQHWLYGTGCRTARPEPGRTDKADDTDWTGQGVFVELRSLVCCGDNPFVIAVMGTSHQGHQALPMESIQQTSSFRTKLQRIVNDVEK